MEIINIKDIKKERMFNYGSFSFVFKVMLNNKVFAFKEYIEPLDPIVKNILIDLSEKEFSENFLTPKYLVETKNGQNILGYITDYNKKLIEISDVFSFDKKVELLKETKKILEKWHNESKRIHGDISPSNILVDEDNNKPYLIDFDTALKINTKNYKSILDSNFPFSDRIYEYLAYYPFNEEIDIFLFNLTTLYILLNDNYIDLIYNIRFEKSDLIKNNKDVKRLSKKFFFEDTKKSYGKEYIIDYIN